MNIFIGEFIYIFLFIFLGYILFLGIKGCVCFRVFMIYCEVVKVVFVFILSLKVFVVFSNVGLFMIFRGFRRKEYLF